MAFNRFDSSTKELVWDGPAAWLERFGIGPAGPVEVIDSDITTLTAAADKVINELPGLVRRMDERIRRTASNRGETLDRDVLAHGVALLQ